MPEITDSRVITNNILCQCCQNASLDIFNNNTSFCAGLIEVCSWQEATFLFPIFLAFYLATVQHLSRTLIFKHRRCQSGQQMQGWHIRLGFSNEYVVASNIYRGHLGEIQGPKGFTGSILPEESIEWMSSVQEVGCQLVILQWCQQTSLLFPCQQRRWSWRKMGWMSMRTTI